MNGSLNNAKVLIIVPAYNEEESIGSVIDDIRVNMPEVDIVVINDGSHDETDKRAREKQVPVLTLPYNQGIGAAMQTGYKYAAKNGYDIAVQFDGDGQHKADQLGILLKPIIEHEADAVIGSRFTGEKGFRSGLARLIGIQILSSVISLIVRKRITDPTSGFRAVNRDVIKKYDIYYPDDYPEPEAIVLLHKAGFRILEVPTQMRRRQGGSSSITPMRSVYYMIKVLLAIMVDLIKKI